MVVREVTFEHSSHLAQKIEDFDFDQKPWGKKMQTRIRNGLQRAGIHTVAQLVECTKHDIEQHVQGIGIVGVVIIEKKLKKIGLRLKK